MVLRSPNTGDRCERCGAFQSTFRNSFTVRVQNALLNGGIQTFEQLRELTPKQLMDLRYFGARGLAEVVLVMSRRGMSLRTEQEIDP